MNPQSPLQGQANPSPSSSYTNVTFQLTETGRPNPPPKRVRKRPAAAAAAKESLQIQQPPIPGRPLPPPPPPPGNPPQFHHPSKRQRINENVPPYSSSSSLPPMPPFLTTPPEIAQPFHNPPGAGPVNLSTAQFTYAMRFLSLSHPSHLPLWTAQLEALGRASGCYRELTVRFGIFPKPATVESVILSNRFASAWSILTQTVSPKVWAYMRALGYNKIPVHRGEERNSSAGGDGGGGGGWFPQIQIQWQPGPVDAVYFATEAIKRMGMQEEEEEEDGYYRQRGRREEIKRMVQEVRSARVEDYPTETHWRKGREHLRGLLDDMIRRGDRQVCESLYDEKPDWAPARWDYRHARAYDGPWEGLGGELLPGKNRAVALPSNKRVRNKKSKNGVDEEGSESEGEGEELVEVPRPPPPARPQVVPPKPKSLRPAPSQVSASQYLPPPKKKRGRPPKNKDSAAAALAPASPTPQVRTKVTNPNRGGPRAKKRAQEAEPAEEESSGSEDAEGIDCEGEADANLGRGK
ncbi:hypothetical protein QBC44DRAFT_321747 [Cladorrhinum sp. PSN332]|nr:hypothetical protein QBC44DRAFT_321747 [Cladorrhinum sp. PSN332]